MKFICLLIGLLFIGGPPGYLHIWGGIKANDNKTTKISIVNTDNWISKEINLVDNTFDLKLPLNYKYLIIFSKPFHQIKVMDVTTLTSKDTIFEYGFNVQLLPDNDSLRDVINIGKIYYDEEKKYFVHKYQTH